MTERPTVLNAWSLVGVSLLLSPVYPLYDVKCNTWLSLLSHKSHRLGNLKALALGIEEGNGCHFNSERY